ncbi:MAG TPA: FmdB family zinc ribbon protein, partial [Tepidiformaceae bacterium]
MAIYEYYCPTCREQFQERRPMSQVAVAATCAQGHPAEKMISSFAAITPGTGFEPSMEMGA